MAKKIKSESGNVKKKLFYKKWWFIAIVALVVLSSTLGGESENGKKEEQAIQQSSSVNSESTSESKSETESDSKPTYEWSIDYDAEMTGNIVSSENGDVSGTIFDDTRPRDPKFTWSLAYLETLKVGTLYDEIDFPMEPTYNDTDMYLEEWDAYSRAVGYQVEVNSDYYYQELVLTFNRKSLSDEWILVNWSGLNLE